ncbi:hypothetical protein B0H13DRAFT_2388953 [Mycena leptocephala]|nr:hypothetical protein B0H13DRAFT_2388953 [Mycena leptocephala]
MAGKDLVTRRAPIAAYSPLASEFEEDVATEFVSWVRKAAGVVLAVHINEEQQQLQQQQHLAQHQHQQQHWHQSPSPQAPSYTPPPPAFTTTSCQRQPCPPPPSPPCPRVPQNKPHHHRAVLPHQPQCAHPVPPPRHRRPRCRPQSRFPFSPSPASFLSAEEDIVGTCGFVNGVKVAHKCSKATVLGKAVEYIAVLKNRETREWAARFGGPETDEVHEGVRAEEDGEEDEEDGEEDGAGAGGGRKHKKLKVEVEANPEPAAAPGPAPRRASCPSPPPCTPLPPPRPAALSTSVPLQDTLQRHYLLGTFARSSPSSPTRTSAPPPHTHHEAHTRHVLAPAVPVCAEISLLQMFHLLVSAAVLLSVLLPLGKSVYAHLRPTPVPTAVVLPTAEKLTQQQQTPAEDDSTDSTDDADVDTELSLSSVSGDDEPAAPAATARAMALAPHLSAAEACILDESTPSPRACALRPRSLSTLASTPPGPPSGPPSPPPPPPPPNSANTNNSTSASTSDDERRLLALLVRPVPLLGARLAWQLWGVGMGLGMGVDEAARRVCSTFSPSSNPASASTWPNSTSANTNANATSASTCTPAPPQVLRPLHEGVAIERLRTVATHAFARAVLPTPSTSTSTPTSTAAEEREQETEEREMEETAEREHALASVRALCGRVGALGAHVGRVLGGGTFEGLSAPSRESSSLSSSSSLEQDQAGEELEELEEGEGEGNTAADVDKLLRALVLYRRCQTCGFLRRVVKKFFKSQN